MNADKLDSVARAAAKRRALTAELRDLGCPPGRLINKSVAELLDLRSRYTQLELMGAPKP